LVTVLETAGRGDNVVEDGQMAICPTCGSEGIVELEADDFFHKYENWIAYNHELKMWECYNCTVSS